MTESLGAKSNKIIFKVILFLGLVVFAYIYYSSEYCLSWQVHCQILSDKQIGFGAGLLALLLVLAFLLRKVKIRKTLN
jgi:hypothetical protein